MTYLFATQWRVLSTRARRRTKLSRPYPPMRPLAAVYFGPRVNAVLAFCFQLAAMRPYGRDSPLVEMSEYHTLPQ